MIFALKKASTVFNAVLAFLFVFSPLVEEHFHSIVGFFACNDV